MTTVPFTADGVSKASSARRFPESPRVIAMHWIIALLIVIAYVGANMHYIARHTAFAYSDEWSYITKTYQIADQHEHLWQFGKLFSTGAAYRAPLFPAVAAAVVGSKGDERKIAEVWLLFRTAVLVIGAGLLALAARRASIVPGILLIVLGSPLFMVFRGLYLMDQPFTCFALLAFAAIIYDDACTSWYSPWIVAFSTLGLFMVKPAAPLLMFPLFAVRGVRQLIRWRRQRPTWKQAVIWLLGYAFLGAMMVYLIKFSAYGAGIHEQWELGNKGYWAISLPGFYLVMLTTAMIPVSVMLGLLLYAIKPRKAPYGWVLIYCGVVTLWWAYFNFVISYNTDDRITINVMPMLAGGVLMVLTRRKWALTAVTVFAGLLFMNNLLISTGFSQPFNLGRDLLTMQVAYAPPAKDAGSLEMMREIGSVVKERGPTPEGMVNVLFADFYIDGGTLRLAGRQLRVTGKSTFNENYMRDWRVTEEPFPVDHFLAARWYLTKKNEKTYGGDLRLWYTLLCADRLLTNPQSPLKGVMEKVFVLPIIRSSVQSSTGEVQLPALPDELTLWHMKRALTASEIKACLEFVAPFRAKLEDAHAKGLTAVPDS